VNRRWIKDNSLTYAVIQAYHTLLPTGRYPVAVIFLTLPFDNVDVNVHPTKAEVRFRNANAVFGAVQRAVRETLVEASPVRSVALGAATESRFASPGWGGSLDERAFARHLTPSAQENLQLDWPERPTDAAATPAEMALEDAGQRQGSAGTRLPIMRVVGQVGAAYIITEGPDGIFLIDQHAAHERILYEQFMAAHSRKEIAAQGLVTSQTVQLPPDQATLLEAHLELLDELGFQVEPFGPNTFVIRAVPALLSRLDPAAALRAVVEDLERGDEPLKEQEEARIILRVCKTAAVKAGQSLSVAEMEAMVQQLETCHNPHTCPHGRPTLIHLSAAQLARQFGRA
jgi:DNA mismatch repair protein MutL